MARVLATLNFSGSFSGDAGGSMSVKVDPFRQPRMTCLFPGCGLVAGACVGGVASCAAAATLIAAIVITIERIRRTRLAVPITSPISKLIAKRTPSELRLELRTRHYRMTKIWSEEC